MSRLAVACALCCTVLASSTIASLGDATSAPARAATGVVEYPIKTAQANARYITKGPDGALWFTEADASKIGRMATDGTVTEYPLHSGTFLNVITTGPDGNLWFTETSPPASIGMITPAGVIKQFKLKSAYAGPVGITAGPDGNLWFTEYAADKIGRITPAGVITEFPLASAPSPGSATAPPSSPLGPFEIAAGPDGNLWFVEQKANKVGRITPDGKVTDFSLGADNNYPNSIIAAPDGNLFFTEVGTGRIGRITPDGVVTGVPIPTRHSGASGIVVGPDGNIWFTETNAGQLGKVIVKTGRVSEFSLPSADGQPIGIALGPDNHLWIVESAANKIAQYAP